MAAPQEPAYHTERYSEIQQAYNNPYYQPLTSSEKQLAVTDYQKRVRQEAVFIHRTNILRYFGIGCLGYFLTYPLLRSAQMQWVRPDIRFIAPEINYRWSALKFIIQKEGPHHLWRGFLPGAAYWGGTVFAQQFCDDFVTQMDTPRTPDETGNIVDLIRGFTYASGISVAQLALHPLRLAQTKLATDVRVKGLSAWYKYATSADCLLRVFRFNGFSGLFAGGSIVFIRNYLFWLAQFIHVNRLTLRDETGYAPVLAWERPLYLMRYELRITQIFVALMPLEVLIARRLYRIPTFKNDRMPKQFPKMWLPTFSGLLNFYRGSFAWAIMTFFMVCLAFQVSEIAKEELLPNNERPSYQSMLFHARYAQFMRKQDELKGNIIEFPTYHPTYGHASTFHRSYYETSRPLHRYSIGDEPTNSELFDQPSNQIYPSSGDLTQNIDPTAIQHGHYDPTQNVYQTPSARSNQFSGL